MDKYILIVATMAALSGISNLYSQDKFGFAKEFFGDMVKEHPKKLGLAGFMTAGGIVYNAILKHAIRAGQYPKKRLFFYRIPGTGLPTLPTVSTVLIGYSVGNTIRLMIESENI